MWEAPTPHCFDWICGTSTGGMLALALASGKSVMDCQFLYMRLKDKVGQRPKPISANSCKLMRKNSGNHWPLKMVNLSGTFQVFVGSKPYSTKPMEELLRNEFGDLKMYQLKGTK